MKFHYENDQIFNNVKIILMLNSNLDENYNELFNYLQSDAISSKNFL